MKTNILFITFMLFVLSATAQEKTPVFTKQIKTGWEASIDSIGYKFDIATGRAEQQAEKQLYKYVSSRFVDEYTVNGGLSPDDIALGVAYKLNFPFWEWKYGEANVALFLGANYGGTNLDEWFTTNVNGYNINTNVHLMFGHIIYPFKKKRLFLETSVFFGLNTYWTKGNLRIEELQIDETYKNKERFLIGGIYGKFGYYVSKRTGIFANVMLPIRHVNDKYMVSNNSIFTNNPETPILFGLGVVIKPKIKYTSKH